MDGVVASFDFKVGWKKIFYWKHTAYHPQSKEITKHKPSYNQVHKKNCKALLAFFLYITPAVHK